MRLTDISIDGFGVLAGCRLEELAPGLNVIHGPNGSGKSTLLQFVRGVWSGFDEARARKFLPPLTGGQPGGSVGVASQSRRLRITRQALPNNTDRLAVTVRQGAPDDGAVIRAVLDSIAPELISDLYAAGAVEVAAIGRLLQRADKDGIDLYSRRRNSRRLEQRFSEVRRRRELLLNGAEGVGETAKLQAACQEAQGELERLQSEADRLRTRLAEHTTHLGDEIRQLEDRIQWLDLERQAVETDLSEMELRPRERPAAAQCRVVVMDHTVPDRLRERIADIDARILHARTVLQDLARDRLQASVEAAGFAGVDPIETVEWLRRQRSTLQALEQETLSLQALTRPFASGPRTVEEQTQWAATVARSTTVLQQQTYLLCQQLARLEQAERQRQLAREQDRVDRCEAELTLHIQQLQHERQHLLADASAPELAALRYPQPPEVAACDCHSHQEFVSQSLLPGEFKTIPAPRATTPAAVDLATQTEVVTRRERLARLLREWDETRAAWRAARDLHCEWDVELSRLVVLERRIAEQQVEVEARQRRLTACLEEADALLVVETGLDRLRGQSFEEETAQVIAEASAHLRRLTAGRYQALQITRERPELAVVNDSGIAVPVESLSRGLLDQVGLSLRIALADEYCRRGVTLPLIFDEVLADCDPDRVDAAVQLLRDASERFQILFLTCQEHIAARFESAGVTVRDFPGTKRPARLQPVAAPPALAAESTATEPSAITAAGNLSISREDRTIHNSEPHWLRVNSPIGTIPSLGEQMARRLAAAGVRTIGDLVMLDAEESPIPLAALQIPPGQLRIWQAEGRLLCCVPHLTGRDAQLLASVGILLPQELAEADPDVLIRRIDRLRGDGRSGWVLAGFVWPDRQTVIDWIAHAHRARTWREAADATDWRPALRMESGRGDVRTTETPVHRFRIDQPSAHRPTRRRRLGLRGRGPSNAPRTERTGERERTSLPLEAGPVMSRAMTPAPTAEPEEASPPSLPRLQFHLELSSRIVDAPSIGPTTARRLERAGVLTVRDLVQQDAQQIADRLQHRRINAEMVRQWQDQSRLMCRVPQLRGHDAQVLVACGLTDPDAVARMSPQALFAIVGPFVATRDGQRLLRSARSPDLAEVTDWITWAQQARTLKAA